jgi:hypothetical protein
MDHQIIAWTEEWINGLESHPLRRAALAAAADAVNEAHRIHYRIRTDAALAAAASVELSNLCGGFWPVMQMLGTLGERDDPHGYVVDAVCERLESAFDA